MAMSIQNSILSNQVYDFITDFPLKDIRETGLTEWISKINDLYNIVYVNKESIKNQDASLFEYQSIPKVYGLMQINEFDPTSYIESGITQIQKEPLALTGKGTIVCFIDTGIDYRCQVFQQLNGKTKILAIWDQTIQSGKTPDGFWFGTEYTEDEINRALMNENPYLVVPSKDLNGHGTAIASLAVGSRIGGENPYQGVAYDAEMIVVKLKECKDYFKEFYLIPEEAVAYQENDIMLAIKYVEQYAERLERPFVICIALGTNMGDHEGNSALSRYLNQVARKRGRAIVVCGGNEGNSGHHYRGNIEGKEKTNQYRNNVEIRVSDQERGFVLEFWGKIPNTYQLRIISPGGETIENIGPADGGIINHRFLYEKTRISIREIFVEPSSGEQLVLMRFQNPTPGIWILQVSLEEKIINGYYDVWLPIQDFLDMETYFIQSDPYITLTEPSLAEDVISVSTYNAITKSFYVESGRGYSRDGRVCPDFAAPGVGVDVVGVKVGKDTSLRIKKMTGSSLAAALTAGAVAQFLQWAIVEGNDPFVESSTIKSYLCRGANRIRDIMYPNREWGYGSLNMEAVFEIISENL